MSDLSDFDADELFHLALQKSNAGDHDDAIRYLKTALCRQPTANTHYLLGAEYAQIGMRDRAIEQMEQALVLDDNLHTARYQLGLLHFLNGANDAAGKAWQPLLDLPASDCLHHLGQGLTILLAGDTANAIAALKKARALNQNNAALNGDIDRMLGNLARAATPVAANPDGPTYEPDDATRKRLISRYDS